MFNRAHVDDIAQISSLALTHGLKGQIWNVADEEPAPPQDVIVYAAALLGVAPPPEEPFDGARLSPMAREFYADNKRVSIAKAKASWDLRPPIRPIARGSALWRGGRGDKKDIADRSSAATKLLTTSRRDRERADNLLPGGPRTVYCFSEPAAGTG